MYISIYLCIYFLPIWAVLMTSLRGDDVIVRNFQIAYYTHMVGDFQIAKSCNLTLNYVEEKKISKCKNGLLCLQQTLYIIGAGKKSQGKTLKWHNF